MTTTEWIVSAIGIFILLDLWLMVRNNASANLKNLQLILRGIEDLENRTRHLRKRGSEQYDEYERDNPSMP